MSKKFLSAILFGALMVTSTGTFVSCKDYDEDIEKINSELSGVKTQIADLQNKINAGKWITNVATTANGVTITLSDGQTLTVTNGKDGATGAAGAPGTQWTISEDGYWVCNGEKTDVVAVGKDGENGKDAQPEVKFENGNWMLWNGTEYVAFEACEELPANVVYAVADVNDPNFVNLYYTNEAGEQVAVRLPMNEGLGQIVVLGNALDIKYHRFNGARKLVSGVWKETAWDGAKATPAKGEYMLTSNQDVVYVQVVPSNYDISKLNFKLVNTKGDEAPIVFGTPVPTTDAVSRAVSESGVYAIPYTLKEMTKAEVTAFNENIANKALSLVANESVRSTYTYAASLAAASDDDATYGDENRVVFVKSEDMGKTVTIAANQKGLVYDSYLIMADAAAKADSVRYGIELDGMNIVAYDAEKINGKTVQFAVRQLGATAKITTPVVKVTFGQEKLVVTEVVLASVEHKAVPYYRAADGTRINGQYIVADFAPYFEKVAATEGDRLMWNSDMSISNIKLIWDEWNEFGESVVEDGIDVTDALYGSHDYLTATGANHVNWADVTNKDFAKLYIAFKENYPGITLGNGQLKAVVTFASSNNATIKHVVEIPFTIANPSAEELAKVYAWDAAYMKDGVLTIVDEDDNKFALDNYFVATASTGAAFYGANVVAKDTNQKLATRINREGKTVVELTGDKNKAYELKGLKVALLGNATSYATGVAVETARTYAIPNLKVKFATATADHIEITGTVSVLSGGKSVMIKDAAIATEGELQFKLVDYAGDLVAYDAMEVVSKGDYIASAALVDVVVYYNEDGEVIKTHEGAAASAPANAEVGAKSSKAGKAIKIVTVETKVAADTAQEIKVNFLKDSAVVVKENKIKVTVKAAI